MLAGIAKNILFHHTRCAGLPTHVAPPKLYALCPVALYLRTIPKGLAAAFSYGFYNTKRNDGFAYFASFVAIALSEFARTCGINPEI